MCNYSDNDNMIAIKDQMAVTLTILKTLMDTIGTWMVIWIRRKMVMILAKTL